MILQDSRSCPWNVSFPHENLVYGRLINQPLLQENDGVSGPPQCSPVWMWGQWFGLVPKMGLGYNYHSSGLELAGAHTDPQKLYHIIAQKQKGWQQPTGQIPLCSRMKQREERLRQPPKPSPVRRVGDPSMVQGVSSAPLHQTLTWSQPGVRTAVPSEGCR